jgi:hypothetical protein
MDSDRASVVDFPVNEADGDDGALGVEPDPGVKADLGRRDFSRRRLVERWYNGDGGAFERPRDKALLSRPFVRWS